MRISAPGVAMAERDTPGSDPAAREGTRAFEPVGCPPVEPISVLVRRGGVTEAVHRVHAVAVRDGEVVASFGDPRLTTFLRSSAKPFQALPLARAREDLTDENLAIASASHRAEPAQIAAVRRLLERAHARPEELDCGLQEGRPQEPIYHNCSGKHAGMLALCRAHGWRSEGYRGAGHRVQRAVVAVVAEAAELAEDEIQTATDGCGVVTHALTLERMATMFARLESLPAGARIVAAMRAHPQLIGGAGAVDTDLMQRKPGWIAKGGAEGLLCAAGPDGSGVALKTEDGSGRAHRAALAVVLEELGEPDGELRSTPVRNAHGETVGELVAEP
jgi:L-asparaginase II